MLLLGVANGSIPTGEPMILRPMYAAYGSAVPTNSLYFVSAASLEQPHDIRAECRITREVLPVRGNRTVRKQDMLYNDYLPQISGEDCSIK